MTTTGNNSTRNFINIQNKYDRVILLVDMDCFFCQVEEKLEPFYKGQPLAVVQYNAWGSGGIIAVNYEARAKGVTRHMRGEDAREHCPEIILCKVPNIREKADTTRYRDAGKEVANVLQRYTTLLERASVDEAYLDITETVNKRMEELQKGEFSLKPQELVNTHAVGYENIGDYVNKITKRFANPFIDDERFQLAYDEKDLLAVRQSDIRLLIGASIAGEVRAAVKADTGYECSAGIAHNKILAKLAAGLNKPNKQTLLPLDEIPIMFETLAVGKIRGLGGKFGEDVCERLGIKFLGQLLKFTESELQRKFDDKNGSWLYNISRGIDLEAVTPRFYSKSIGCCKRFPGRNNITGLKTLKHWLSELAIEINERLEKDLIENNRKAKQMVVQFVQEFDGEEVSSSRSGPINNYDKEYLATYALEVIKTNTKTFFRPGSDLALNNAIRFLGFSVGKFETISTGQSKLEELFANQAAKQRKSSDGTAAAPVKEQVERKEKPPTEMEKSKNFFENYLQTHNKKAKPNAILNESSIEERKEEIPQTFEESCTREIKEEILQISEEKLTKDQNEDQPHTPEQSKTFMEEYKKKLRKICAQQGIEVNLTPPNKKDGFFAKLLQQQREQQEEQEQNFNNMDLDLQNLAAELDEIESNTNVTEAYNDDQPSTSKRKIDDIQSMDYTKTYAEYAQPELRPEIFDLIKCTHCNIQIPDDPVAIQTHYDEHYAQELSRQLRKEQREESHQHNQSKIVSPQQAPKKQKKSANNAASASSAKKSKNTNSITKFLATALPSEPTNTDGMERCAECQAFVKITEMPEHADYHMAKRLQRQLNQLEVRTVSKSPAASGKKPLNNTLSSSNNRSIAQFFSQGH